MQTINVYIFNLEKAHYQDPYRQMMPPKKTAWRIHRGRYINN